MMINDLYKWFKTIPTKTQFPVTLWVTVGQFPPNIPWQTTQSFRLKLSNKAHRQRDVMSINDVMSIDNVIEHDQKS